MIAKLLRNCPLCGAPPADGFVFPYAARFNNTDFKYIECSKCSTVFVDPVPDIQTFSRMYAKDIYHDCHYEDTDGDVYLESAKLLRQYLPEGGIVLDYGCGIGTFLKALGVEEFIPFGVEFDADAAKLASSNANCIALSVSEFSEMTNPPQFDAIHLGDVLEHLPNPAETLKELITYLKPDGILFVEGPLEINPSLVYWSAKLFGRMKRIIKPDFIASNAPTHLFRTGGMQQLAFFKYIDIGLDTIHWRVYEAGWPYINGGVVKSFIARIAIMLSGKQYFEHTFGNRFQGLFVIPKLIDDLHQK
jgi:2-polyprenyl-3-methyl-5-hydroxy-6-metoxy-1,4-benzoquinol methylase